MEVIFNVEKLRKKGGCKLLFLNNPEETENEMYGYSQLKFSFCELKRGKGPSVVS